MVAITRRDLLQRMVDLPEERLKNLAMKNAPPLDFAGALCDNGVRLIAEVKKASPSRGVLKPDLDPVALARTYARSGAAAISVLTEPHYFQGSLEHLKAIREALGEAGPPLLRKDFVFHPYQVYEARAYRADAVLLIVAMLRDSELRDLLSLSREMGMECLVEVHNKEELSRAVESGAKIIGINNRDLETFDIDITTSQRLAPLVPRGSIIVAESGINTRKDVLALQKFGVDAVLVGEALVTAPDVAAKIKELI
ncbi:MAG: indole-3-glycerol phosphate synthase TrpC [Chloroflexi bacterium]|nr:indole-3-glycerol phosphate synthase TrpC [Chloroflexota bacterium]